MRAIAVRETGGPERLELLDLPVPEPGRGEVLVRVVAAGVNLVDAMFREGYLDTGRRPLVMGSDLSGVVERLGSGVDRLAVGDEVFGYKLLGDGTYAERAVIPADWLAAKPAALTHVEAAALPCVGLTACQALDALELQAGETLLVTAAAGGVGSVVVQLAAAAGVRVVGTASARNQAHLRELGVTWPVDYADGDWTAAVRAAVPGGVDAAVTCLGGETKRRTPAAVRDGGRLVWISGEDKPGPPMERMLRGAYVGGLPSSDTLARLADAADAGRLRVVVEHVHPLAEAAAAQRRVASGHVRGKLVIDVSGDHGPA